MSGTVNGATLDTEVVPVADLVSYHRNPRQGNVNAIARSLDVLGQYRPIVANRGTHTGRASEVVAGNHTLAAARKLGWQSITVVWVDVDDETCARIVAADNRTADLGGYDDRLLAELLTDLPDLDGTGYDPGDLDELLTSLTSDTPAFQRDPDNDDGERYGGGGTDPAAEWQGMPEFQSDDLMAEHTIKVHFRNRQDRDAFAQLVGQKLTDSTRYIWHPINERDSTADLAYVSPQGE